MRISDWSSDVCSSDLGDAKPLTRDQACPSGRRQIQVPPISAAARGMSDQGKGEAKRPSTALNAKAASAARLPRQIGSATCRERVCQYVSISVVAVSLQNKSHYTTETLHQQTIP